MKILLATDGSEYSNHAAEELAARSLPPNAEVHIISVFHSTPLITSVPAPMGGLAGAWEEANAVAKNQAQEAVKNAAKILAEKHPNLSITATMVEGSPKHAILEKADELGADLIVVGSHGRGAVGRFLLGSVSQSIALHAKCSVEIARRKETS
jgi:nucleotide-binding universal stress UspA family protein